MNNIRIAQETGRTTQLVEKIRMKMTEMEKQNWKMESNWIKAHAGHRGNELADQLAKVAANNRDVNECYETIPKKKVC